MMKVSYSYTEKKRIRKYFGKLSTTIDVPFLLKLQIDSYNKFLQLDVPAENLKPYGLHGVFLSIFPITSFSGNAV